TLAASDYCASMIVDAPNAGDSSGTVTYKFDVVILTPTDPNKANGTLLSFAAQSSGVSTIVKTISPSRGSNVYVGGADPRREGIALGDSPI
ncbi:MAG: hypothetical protein ACKOQV_04760, partial [Betaproteobacteria bacterium]